MRSMVSLGLVLLATLPAEAAGGFTCFAEDPPVTYQLGAGISRGVGSAAFNFSGTLTIADGVPEGFREATFQAGDLTMYWLDEMEFRLLAHHEQDNKRGYIEVEVRTQVSEEGVYGGQFEVTVLDNLVGGEGTKIRGMTTCWVE
jgi:hypothetical protein